MDRNNPFDLMRLIGEEYNPEQIKSLITKENVNTLRTDDGSNASLLHMACLFQLYTIIHHLLSIGADVEARDNEQATPIFYANEVGVAKILLDAGANMHACAIDDGTTITTAIDDSEHELLLLYVDYGAVMPHGILPECVTLFKQQRKARAEEALVLLSVRSKSRCISKDVLSLVAEHLFSVRKVGCLF